MSVSTYPILTTCHCHCRHQLWGAVSPQGRGWLCRSERRIEHGVDMSVFAMCCHCWLWGLVCPRGRGLQLCSSTRNIECSINMSCLCHTSWLSWPSAVGPGAAMSIGRKGRAQVTWLQKRKLAKKKKKEREKEQNYQKTCLTCDWGRGIDQVAENVP